MTLLYQLPGELIISILSCLDPHSLVSCSLVCRRFNLIISSERVFQYFHVARYLAIRAGNLPIPTSIITQIPPQTIDKRGQSLVHALCSLNDLNGLLHLSATLNPSDLDTLINLQDRYGITPLHIAVKAGYTEVVEFLLSRNVDLFATNFKRETPLLLAAQTGSVPLLQTLLNHFSKQSSNFESATVPSTIPILHCLAENNHAKALSFVLGQSALYPLLSNAIDVNQPDDFGQTSLHKASITASLECLKILIDHGADVKILDSDRKSPLDYALTHQGYFDEGARVLLDHDPFNHGIGIGYRKKIMASIARSQKQFFRRRSNHSFRLITC